MNAAAADAAELMNDAFVDNIVPPHPLPHIGKINHLKHNIRFTFIDKKKLKFFLYSNVLKTVTRLKGINIHSDVCRLTPQISKPGQR